MSDCDGLREGGNEGIIEFVGFIECANDGTNDGTNDSWFVGETEGTSEFDGLNECDVEGCCVYEGMIECTNEGILEGGEE